MKFSLAMVAALLAVTSQHFLADARAASFEEGVEDVVDELFGDCGCYKILGIFDNRCDGNSGTKLIGCSRSNRFLQCLNESCSIQTCPAGELWNSTANACSLCPAGQHVDAQNKTCVCSNGTTTSKRGHDWDGNWQSKTCVQCPTNSTQDVDSCYCSLPLIKDEVSNACRECPVGATLKEHKRCQCNNESLFWNPSTWQCSECPGVWQDTHEWLFDEKVCVCPGNNTVFLRRNVSCYECPIPAQASLDGDDCECPLEEQRFDWKTLACICEGGRVLNKDQTACVHADTTTTAADVSTVTGSADSTATIETTATSNAVTATSEESSTASAATEGSSAAIEGGSTTTVGGATTTAGGSTTTAGGSTTTAGGSTTTAGGSTTTAGGSTTTAGGSTTTAGGSTTTAGGSTTTAGGSTTTAGGSTTTAGGSTTTA